jgi:hypothetical protein
MRQLTRDQVVQVTPRFTGRKLREQGPVGDVTVAGELPLAAVSL